MSDWMFETGHDQLPLIMPDETWVPDQGATTWLDPVVTDDLEAWLYAPQPKGDLDDFGPTFNPAEEEDATELDEVVVTGTRLEGVPTGIQITIGDIEPPVGDGGGGGGQTPNPLVKWGLEYVLGKLADWILNEIGDGAEKPDFENFDPDDIDVLRISGDRVFASTDNGRSWYVDLDRSAANGWESHVRFDDNGFPWVDLGDGAGYRLAPSGWTGS
jgi:hypothetical protein